MKRPLLLLRSEVRRRYDKSTQTSYLVCTDPRLDFFEDFYGLPEGTFFSVMADEVPFPDDLKASAALAGVSLHEMVEGRQLREAVVDALILGAMVDAPELLANVAEPHVYWADHDRYALERKHRESVARILDIHKMIEGQLRLRSMLRGAAIPVAAVEEPVAISEPQPEPPAEPQTEVIAVEETEEAEFESYAPSSVAVESASNATKQARDAELPQRLPAGSRRKLTRMPPAAYVIRGEAVEPRVDLCAAMADAQAAGRKGSEATVVDWDGEWPVVVRRYGADGRTVYKVESALKRQGVAS